MKKQRKNEIIDLLIKPIEEYDNWYICNTIKGLFFKGVISKIEFSQFMNFFIENKPTRTNQFKKFVEHKSWRGSFSWWDSTGEGREERIKFLKELKKLK